MKKYTNPLLRATTAAALLFIIWDQRTQIKQLKSEPTHCQQIISERDSLKNEMFVKDIEIGRYEHMLDLFESEFDSTCKEKMYELMNETE